MSRSTNNRSGPAMLMIGIGLIFVAVAAFILLKPAQEEAATVPPPPAAEHRIPYPDIARASISEAKAAFDSGSAVFLDVRGDAYYNTGHIPGAVSMAEDDVSVRVNELDPKAWIIPYCT